MLARPARGPSSSGENGGSADAEAPYLSVLIPIYNERENLEPLYHRLVECLDPMGVRYEVVMVDDGSTDGSPDWIAELCGRDGRFGLVRLNRNFGQTAALAAAIDHARGEVVVTMDADMQNDPADIPMLLETYRQGYDLVSGWRRNRKDTFITRTLPSFLANALISRYTGVRLHDYGCTLKAYRASLLRRLNLYGEMHRFLPALLAHLGARITEVEVSHHPRHAGTSKYGLGRTFKVLLDLMTVKFLGSFATKPIYLFGGTGLACLGVAALSLAGMIYLKVNGTDMILTPLPVMTSMFSMLGVQFLLMGLLAELLIRTYYESQQKKIYVTSQVIEPTGQAPRPAAGDPEGPPVA